MFFGAFQTILKIEGLGLCPGETKTKQNRMLTLFSMRSLRSNDTWKCTQRFWLKYNGLYEFARAATTDHYALGGLNNCIFTVLEAVSLRSGCWGANFSWRLFLAYGWPSCPCFLTWPFFYVPAYVVSLLVSQFLLFIRTPVRLDSSPT